LNSTNISPRSRTLGKQETQCVIMGLFKFDIPPKVERELKRKMMDESNKMITHSAQSLGQTVGELKDLIVRCES
jgi:hypothetical protein